MTSSALASTVGGKLRPSALAVLAFITSANFVSCSTGRFAGFTPLKILSTWRRRRRKVAGAFTLKDGGPRL